MPTEKFCFVQTSPFGQSKEARRFEQLRARAHAASVSPRRKRKSSKISNDVLHQPPLEANISTTPYYLPLSPPPPDGESSDAIDELWSAGALAAFSSAGPLSPPDSPQALKEEPDNVHEDQEEPVQQNEPNTIQSSIARTLVGPHRGADLIPSDYRCFRGMRTDPFNCIPARGSESVSSVVDYHAQVMAPNHAPIYKIFNVRNVYTSYYFELLQNEDFLYTGVASVQAVIDQLRSPGQKPSQTVIRHIGTAMRNLRRRLEKPGATADDLTIMTVLFLAVVARAIGDLSSHEVHKQSVRLLVSSRGGLDALGHDGLAKCTLMQYEKPSATSKVLSNLATDNEHRWESFWALNTGSTIFPDVRPTYAPIYPRYPFSEDLCLLVSKLPPGFQALAKQKRLAIDVLEVLARAAEAGQMQKKARSIVTQEDIFRSRERRYHDFWEACTCLAAPDEDGPNFEKLVVLALLLYCLHTFSPMRAVTAIYNGSRMKLTSDIGKRKCGNVEEERCLLWIWMVTVDSWRNASGALLPTGIESVKQVKERWASVSGWTETTGILGEFFWDEPFAKRCKIYWHMVTSDG